MNMNLDWELSRRRALQLGGGLAAGLLMTPASQVLADAAEVAESSSGTLPVDKIQAILQAQGTVSKGVLSVEQNRNDLSVTGPGGIPFKPAFEIKNEFFFQPLAPGSALFNGDLALLPSETNAVIDAALANGLIFQAFHQHFFDLTPQIFHIHLRGIGPPQALAHAVAAVVAKTATPLPQTSPPNPPTPLNSYRLAHILGGTSEVGDDGVVTVSVGRAETIRLGGVIVKNETGISHSIAFEPLNDAAHTAVAPDFSLIASEVVPVVSLMRAAGFTVHCLYNQETAEHPQLFYSHQLAVGDAYELAHKVRTALNLTNSMFV